MEQTTGPSNPLLANRLAAPRGIRLTGPTWDGSAFRVDEAATTAAAAVLDAAAAWTGESPAPLHRRHALAASSGWFEVDGRRPAMWADLSGYYTDRTGRSVQLHCNFPHHAAGVREYFGLGTGAGRDEVAAAITESDALELETGLVANGMIAAAERSLDEWALHPHAEATNDLPLCEATALDDAPAAPPSEGPLRVLDFSRVLAGPVCGQTLAALGADVLRVGAAHLPSVDAAVMATGFGKRNTFCDLRTAEDRTRIRDLAAEADVVIDAYRPGALAGHGLGPSELAELRPGVVIVQVSAFDWVGPWAGRRGFDSIVQTTTGITRAGAEAAGHDRPTPLPFQALDYCTGYLAAASALHLLSHQRREGGSWLARLSLLRTRNWLVSLGGPAAFEPVSLPDASAWSDETASDFGLVRAPRPLVGRWASGPRRLGSAPPAWV